MPFLELSLVLKLRRILPLVGHFQVEGSLPVPVLEDWGRLLVALVCGVFAVVVLVVLACGVFRAVVLVACRLLTLLPEAPDGVPWLPGRAGVGWFRGFAVDEA